MLISDSCFIVVPFTLFIISFSYLLFISLELDRVVKKYSREFRVLRSNCKMAANVRHADLCTTPISRWGGRRDSSVTGSELSIFLHAIKSGNRSVGDNYPLLERHRVW